MAYYTRSERSEAIVVDLGQNLSDSFEYAKKLFGDARRLIILIILGLIPIVDWIVLGYQARVLKESPGIGVPPKLEKYGELFVEGAKVVFASFIYMLVPIVLIVLGAVSMGLSLQGPAIGAQLVFGGTGVALLAVGIILGIIILIVLAAALAHMIKTGKFGKAFAFGEIFSVIRGIGWAKYLCWIIVIVVMGAIVAAISRIPWIGWLISAIIQPLLGVFVFRSLGMLYNDGAPAELRVQPPVVGGLVCASCGTQLQPQHKFCPHCGAPTPVPLPPPAPEPSTKYCISCGAKIPANASFCGSCGAKQN